MTRDVIRISGDMNLYRAVAHGEILLRHKWSPINTEEYHYAMELKKKTMNYLRQNPKLLENNEHYKGVRKYTGYSHVNYMDSPIAQNHFARGHYKTSDIELRAISMVISTPIDIFNEHHKLLKTIDKGVVTTGGVPKSGIHLVLTNGHYDLLRPVTYYIYTPDSEPESEKAKSAPLAAAAAAEALHSSHMKTLHRAALITSIHRMGAPVPEAYMASMPLEELKSMRHSIHATLHPMHQTLEHKHYHADMIQARILARNRAGGSTPVLTMGGFTPMSYVAPIPMSTPIQWPSFQTASPASPAVVFGAKRDHQGHRSPGWNSPGGSVRSGSTASPRRRVKTRRDSGGRATGRQRR